MQQQRRGHRGHGPHMPQGQQHGHLQWQRGLRVRRVRVQKEGQPRGEVQRPVLRVRQLQLRPLRKQAVRR